MNDSSKDATPSDHESQLIDAAQREAAELGEAPASPKPAPDAVPGYRIIGEIGRGGMGVVYRALQVSTKRIVALKVMLGGSFASRSAQKRFQREVELAARFQHPGIVRVLESGHTSTGQQYYAMDHVDGVQLDRWLSVSQPNLHTTLGLFTHVCDAVEYAHQHDVIHRDLKPGNVLIDDQGEPHILDFGLAKATDQTDDEDVLTMATSIPGHVMGTLRYLSPEQAAGTPAEIDARTDVYALGVMLFEALTGALPFDSAGSASDVIQRIQQDPPKSPSSLSSRIDGELETIVLKALEKEKARRYQSAAELREDLGRYLRDEPILARPPSSFYILRKKLGRHRVGFALTTAILILGLAGLSGAMWRQQHELAKARRDVLKLQRWLEFQPVERYLGRAAVLAEQHPELPEAGLARAQAWFRLGRKSGEQGLVKRAIDTLQDRLARDPSQWAVRALLAEMYRQAGSRQQGDQLQAQADQDAPDTAEGWYLRSFATLDVNKAMQYAKQAAKRDQAHLLAWERLAYLCLLVGDFDGALAAANELMDLGSDRLEWMMFQGYTLTKQRRYNEAVRQYTEVVALFPNQVQPYRCRALPYLCLEKHAQAIEDYSKAGALRGALSVWERYLRATPLWITGRTEEAAADYRAFRTLQGQSTRADARLFLILCEQARLLREEDRVVDAQKALEEAHGVLERARSGATQGSWLEKIFECLAGERAPEELVQAADPKNVEQVCEGYYYAGEACRLEGQIVAARMWFRKCVDTDIVFDQDTFPPDPKPEYHLARWRLSQLTAHTGPTSRSRDE